MPSATPQTVDSQFHRYYKKISPILKKPKAREYTSAIFTFLAMALFAWYAIRPTAQTIIFLKREIEDKTTVNKQLEGKITALIEAQAIYESIQNKLPVLEQALPHNPDAVVLARQLTRLAAVSGASVSAMQIPSLPLITTEATLGAKLAPPKPLEEFSVHLVLTGSYDSLKAFLDGLLSLRRITAIDTISLRKSAQLESQPDNLQLSVQLMSYYTTQ